MRTSAVPTRPAPTRIEPIVPDGFTFDRAPVLILSGDLDTSAPTEVNRPLQTVYPKGILAIVANASHDAAAPFSGTCAGPLIGRFFDTLQADANACATYKRRSWHRAGRPDAPAYRVQKPISASSDLGSPPSG